jgi:hypothetical protein
MDNRSAHLLHKPKLSPGSIGFRGFLYLSSCCLGLQHSGS